MTSKQRAYLRSMASGLDTIFQVGKQGVGAQMTEQISNALNARELIKIHVLENSSVDVREAAETLAARTQSEVVTVIGKRFVLYRESKDRKRIVLP